ncbi:Protein RRNAD1, partial [Lamprotornis superbus]
WQPALASATPAQLAGLLRGQGGPGAAWPLSLLAFAAAARALAFPRGCPGGSPRPPCQSSHLHPLLRLHIKPKKQHEIQRLSKLLQRLSQATGCERVVDIGAGQIGEAGRTPFWDPSHESGDGGVLYAHLGLPLAGLDPARIPLDSEAVGAMLEQQHKVVAFCTLGQLLAPVVETLILLDRLLYLREQGFHCALVPLFNPQFSPRNLVLVAARTPLATVLAGLDKDSEDRDSSEDRHSNEDEDLGEAESPREGQSPHSPGHRPQ